MLTDHDHPYKVTGHAEPVTQRPEHRSGLCTWLSQMLCLYYVASAVTLPFANRIWFGEIPVLAVIQLPKTFLKSLFQHAFLWFVRSTGLSQGSFSPDYMATHPWAMAAMSITPLIVLIILIRLTRPRPLHSRVIMYTVTLAAVDTAVTFWFDSTSALSLYTGSWF
ncbi:MAG: hypothetical protein KDA81_05870 [Planctomycetaceae bacterium]|nr:hypothetical protein [Planctomycetaceae bacterium]